MYHVIQILYPPENKPPPPFSAVHLAQTGRGHYFQICAIGLERKPPPLAGSLIYELFSAYITLT